MSSDVDLKIHASGLLQHILTQARLEEYLEAAARTECSGPFSGGLHRLHIAPQTLLTSS